MTNVISDRTVGEVVAEDYRTAGVFKKCGLDFCCGGRESVVEACEQKEVDASTILKELEVVTQEWGQNENYNEWPLDFLVDYIVNTHPRFVRDKLPEIELFAKKVAKVHGSQHKELNEILYEFLLLEDELLNHLEKEEQMLFPYIKELVKYAENSEKIEQKPHFGAVENQVRLIEAEHDEAGEAMGKIQRRSNDFTPPQDACASYRVLFQNLEGFQDNLHKHVHLENNILFPKALGLKQD